MIPIDHTMHAEPTGAYLSFSHLTNPSIQIRPAPLFSLPVDKQASVGRWANM